MTVTHYLVVTSSSRMIVSIVMQYIILYRYGISYGILLVCKLIARWNWVSGGDCALWRCHALRTAVAASHHDGQTSRATCCYL